MDRPTLDPDTLGLHLQEPYRSHFLHMLFWGNLKWLGETPVMAMLRSTCGTYAKRFTEKFPELKEQPGFIAPMGWKGVTKGSEHIWCVKEDGTVVDPTLEQFYWAAVDHIEPVYHNLDKENDIIAIGKCMNCGFEIYGTYNQLMEEGRQELCADVLDPETGTIEQSCASEYEQAMRREMRSWN